MVAWVYITSNTTWQAPLLTNGIIIIACGGGGGGGCAHDTFSAGGGGGAGAQPQFAFLPVTPLTTYTITIGDGGLGGVDGPNQSDYCGKDGYATRISLSGNILFSARGAGGAGVNMNDGFNHGGLPWSNPLSTDVLENTCATPVIPGSGGGWDGTSGYPGLFSMRDFAGGASSSDNYGAAGGGAGPQGDGGDAGTAMSPNGDDASSNTAAGGGGGNQGSTRGGNGGSGYMYIIW